MNIQFSNVVQPGQKDGFGIVADKGVIALVAHRGGQTCVLALSTHEATQLGADVIGAAAVEEAANEKKTSAILVPENGKGCAS